MEAQMGKQMEAQMGKQMEVQMGKQMEAQMGKQMEAQMGKQTAAAQAPMTPVAAPFQLRSSGTRRSQLCQSRTHAPRPGTPHGSKRQQPHSTSTGPPPCNLPSTTPLHSPRSSQRLGWPVASARPTGVRVVPATTRALRQKGTARATRMRVAWATRTATEMQMARMVRCSMATARAAEYKALLPSKTEASQPSSPHTSARRLSRGQRRSSWWCYLK
jgi:hypothetical protein